MPNGFYFTLGFFGALLFVALFVPTKEACTWAWHTLIGGLIVGTILGLIFAAIAA